MREREREREKEKIFKKKTCRSREGSFQHTFSMAGIYALADIERYDTRSESEDTRQYHVHSDYRQVLKEAKQSVTNEDVFAYVHLRTDGKSGL